MEFDVTAIRRQFPFLRVSQGESVPVYLDSAATTQKPDAVIAALSDFYASGPGNVHRGLHRQTERATERYEATRDRVRAFIGAAHPDEIIFTKNATESINLVAHGWARENMGEGDIVLLSILEHHANIVPWLQLQEENHISIRWIDIDDAGSLRLDDLEDVLHTGRVKLVAVTGQSNVLGTRPPLERVISAARGAGAATLVDAAQLASHAPIDVTKLDCDFLAFSGHKLYGPGGIGVLYARRNAQRHMRPFLGGGGMVRFVSREKFIPAETPAQFEAGTPPVADAVGLAAALDWQAQCSWDDRIAQERTLIATALRSLGMIEGLHILGSDDSATTFGCVAFTVEGIHPHDLTDLLGQRGIALRAGHHCAAPLHERLDIPASARLSIGLYTTAEEIETCAAAIEEIRKQFSA